VAVEPPMEVSDMAVTVASEGVEPMEDVEEMKVAPSGLTTRHDDGGKDGQRVKKKVDFHKDVDGNNKDSLREKAKNPSRVKNPAGEGKKPEMIYAPKKVTKVTVETQDSPREEKKSKPVAAMTSKVNIEVTKEEQ
jgi:hypothetical protein